MQMNFQSIGQTSSISSTNSSSSFVLREGQMFQGTIKQLFPDNMAEVQVGGNKFFAKLETPLKAGDTHFFQVTSTKDQIELKVVTGNVGSSPQEQLTKLLESMNLPKTAEMRQIAAHFLKNNVPLNKEQIVQAENWMKALPNDVSKATALEALSRMVDLKIPFTQDVFQSLLSGAKPVGMTFAIQTLMAQLAQDDSLSTDLKMSLESRLQSIQQPLQKHIGTNVLARAVLTLLDANESIANKLQSLTLLKDANIIAKDATLSNWMQPSSGSQITSMLNVMQSAGPNRTSVLLSQLLQIVKNDATLSNEQKLVLGELIQRYEQAPKTASGNAAFVKQFSEIMLKMEAGKVLENQGNLENLLRMMGGKGDSATQLMDGLVKVTSDSSSPFVQSLSQLAQANVLDRLSGEQLMHAMKSLMKDLGLQYESSFTTSKQSVQEAAETLKPLLMSAIAEQSVSQGLRESAEAVLSRINGMQLLSSDSNMHQQQIVMQLPLAFLGKKMDATLHWKGRMKEDGKIDSDYARIMFYLQMESLNETVVDMQVQNRIVSVTIFNDYSAFQNLALPLKEKLAAGLESKGYQLSGVHFKTFATDSSKSEQKKVQEKAPGVGVDIRV